MSPERDPHLREKTSAAYGIGRDSAAGALAERCPTRLFPKRPPQTQNLVEGRRRVRHAPSENGEDWLQKELSLLSPLPVSRDDRRDSFGIIAHQTGCSHCQ